jgi:signal peptidase I
MTTPKPKPEKRKETLGETIRSFAFMIFLALVFRSFAYEPFHIPSGSMLSTLYEGDYIFVSKFSYGYSRFSFPFKPDLFDGKRIMASEPKRGDVVVFRNPAMIHVDYIKRIIGLPGDEIQMKHGRLYINGAMVDQTRAGQVKLPNECNEMRELPRYNEVLPGGSTHVVLDDPELDEPLLQLTEEQILNQCLRVEQSKLQRQQFNPDNTGVYVVPDGHYFMMGDNRDHSQDSRFSPALGFADAPGFVPFENFVGRAEVIAFSWSGQGGRWFKKID